MNDITAATAAVVLEINAQTGAAWRIESRLTGGLLGGAWLVYDGDSAAVLKWHDPASSVPRNPDAAEVVAYLREHGYPTPAWLSAGTTAAGYPFSIQEYVRGTSVRLLDTATATLMLELVRRHRQLSPPTDLSWSASMRDHVFAHHESHDRLAAEGDAVAEVLGDALALAASYESTTLIDDELVLSDFKPEHILVHEGRVAGVIDIDAAGRGCAVYDVLHAAIGGVFWDADPAAVAMLERYAFEEYGPGPVAIAAATLVIEALVWRVERYPERVESGAAKARDWIAALQTKM